MNEKEISLLHLITRRWKLSVGIIAATIGLAGLITLILPRRYESEMKFLVNHERADLVITPDKNQSTVTASEVTETEVNSEMELLKSHDILEAIVRDHQLYLPFETRKSAQPSRKSIERASLKLQKALTISALRKTNIIDVTYRDADPDLAVAILHDLGDHYLTSHLAVHSAPGTDKFFSEQVQNFSVQLIRARAALAVFHQQRHLFSMPQQQSAVLERFQTIDSQLKDVDAQLGEQQSRLNENARQLSGISSRVVTQVRQTSNQFAIQQLEPMLTQLENRRIELVTKFKPTDRLVVELDSQIANTRAELARIREERSDEQTTDLNTLHQGLNSDFTKGQVELKGLQTRRIELARMRQSYLQQLGDMDQSFVQLQSLEQYEKQAEDNYVLYTHRLDEARLAQALDQQKFSNVAMIEKPVSSPIPVSPKLSLNLAVGALLGLFLSLGIAFLLETRDSSTPPALTPDLSREPLFPARAYQAASGD